MQEKIEIVSHCWAGQLELYAKLLQLQVNSLVLRERSMCDTTLTVVHSPADAATLDVLRWASLALPLVDVKLNSISVGHGNLFRRAIGRNIAALESKADVVWFTDVDYLFTEKCLDATVRACLENPTSITYPKLVMANVTHKHGDELISKAADSKSVGCDFDRENFRPRGYGKAIGGIQIVLGDRCRSLGYLDGTKWVKPVKTTDGFLKCHGDTRFRKSVGSQNPADIPGVYRVRHSECGRNENFE